MAALSRSLILKTKRIPARVNRIDGEFPPFAGRPRGIIDIDPAADTAGSPSEPIVIPTRQKGKSQLSLAKSRATRYSDSRSHASGKILDQINEIPVHGVAEKPKLKKFRWMPNPFLQENDSRQGGPLYFSKYFSDRDRRLDEKLVRVELSKQNDALAGKSTEADDTEKTDRSYRRKRAVWSNYRPLTEKEADQITSLDKLGRILANEIHLINKGQDRNDMIARLDTKFKMLLPDADRKDLAWIVKCVYFFGVYQDISVLTLNRALEAIQSDLRALKPDKIVYLLEALARLRFRDERCLAFVDSLSLCWPLVAKSSTDLLIRAANAIARLDLSMACPGSTASLATILSEALPGLSRKQLEKIKAVTLTDSGIFHDVMLLDYFVLCQQHDIQYSRHLLMSLLLHKQNKRDLITKLPASSKEWLDSLLERELARRETQKVASNSQVSSDLHTDIARVFDQSRWKSDVVSGVTCGPLTFDLFIPFSNTVIDACSEFQFYKRTAKFTSDARLRHSMIRQLGFKLIPVSHFQWKTFSSDTEKLNWLTKQIDS
jgi:hypothetical protein